MLEMPHIMGRYQKIDRSVQTEGDGVHITAKTYTL